ncbi:MAG: putative kinase, aminoglycoside phosphotransferase family [Nocardioides sp.]|nr:putative kinase, aminoglycoside phosphotransferase family [Nocardioides sp.]
MPDLDHDDLRRRVTVAARRAGAHAEVHSLRRLEGGVSSLTYAAVLRLDGTERPVVVKAAPPGLAPVRNRDVLRQARLLRTLADDPPFPVPGVLLEDGGDPPDVPPLFVMELCAGVSYEPGLDVAPAPPTPEVAAERMRVATRALAHLQAHRPVALGLDDEPGCPADELDRWCRLFDTVDRDIAPGRDALADRLRAAPPSPLQPRLLHGDYRLANMLFTGTTLEAVIDWEIWSVGDPRVDLAWLLMHAAPAHVFHEDRPVADRVSSRALPGVPELLDVYREERVTRGAGQDVDDVTTDLGWFVALCHLKVASTIGVIWKRERRAERPEPKLVTAAAHLDEVLAAGHTALDTARGAQSK